METIYQWDISSMDTAPSLDGLTDVVVNVNWKRNATAINNDITYFADIYGQMPCTTPSDTDFTAYPDLTFEQVCGWLDAGLDVPALNASLDAQIENQINPPIIVLPNPWAIPNTEQEIIAGDQPIV